MRYFPVGRVNYQQPRTMAFVNPVSLAGSKAILGERVRGTSVCSPTRGPKMSADTDAPPESRVEPYYPAKGRFLAPRLSLMSVEGCELLNTVQLDFSAPALDLAEAGRLKAALSAPILSESFAFDYNGLFSYEAEDSAASNVVDRYYPAERRYEVPVVTFNRADDEEDCSFKVEYGNILPDESVNDEPVEGAAVSEGGLPPVVSRAYGEAVRYLAPVVEFGKGELSLSVSMQAITGGPDPSLYPAKFDFHAPEIVLKREAFEGDSSAFVSVSSPEVQLTGLNASL